MYGLYHGIIHVFNTILYENEFQNPQQQTISLFPEHSTLNRHCNVRIDIGIRADELGIKQSTIPSC
jgi:hypothetical protein